MALQGYVRFPNIFQDRIVFVAEDDLWEVSSSGGRAERLTAGVGEVRSPRFSPDGEWLAFVGREEGPSEVYSMPSSGGSAQRLTFQSGNCRVLGWSADGSEILFSNTSGQINSRFEVIYAIKLSGGQPRQLPFGLANGISYGPQQGVVLGRNVNEISHWKRYRGGTAGHLWCDVDGSGDFQRLLQQLHGNIADPCWVGERIYFLSDHEGIGNVYSCTPAGEDVRQHTNHHDFYARHLSTDGHTLVYHSGADLFLFDPESDTTRQVPVTLPSVRTQRNRRFVSSESYLDTIALHPQGYAVALTTRGKAFSLGNWAGPVLQHGEVDGVRYRYLEWLNDGKRLVAICDAPGRETLVVFNPEEAEEPRLLADIEFGRAVNLVVSPTDDIVAISNHRNELIVVNLEQGSSQILDRSPANRIHGIAWSPDGRWLAYGFFLSSNKSAIKLGDIQSGETYQITNPVLQDIHPSFDPEGKYLYFLGYRIFTPVNDNLQFDLGFPKGVKPYAITLRKDLPSPFVPVPKAPAEKEKEKDKEKEKEESPTEPVAQAEEGENTSEPTDATPPTEKTEEVKAEEEEKSTIDLDGISERVIPFPVPEGRYNAVYGIKGKVLYLSYDDYTAHEPVGRIDYYDFDTYKSEKLLENVSSMALSRDAKTLIYRSHRRLRVLKAGEKAKTESGTTRESGWLDLHRVKVSVQPASEWKQMFAEAWRLQREQFWTEDMSGIDWEAIYALYSPLIDRVSSRSELSDLLWELQGELGTSHAYEYGGEYRSRPFYSQGFLGVDWLYDAEKDRYRIARIVKGDPSEKRATSPLTAPGLNVQVSDAVLAINGQRVRTDRSPQSLLVNQAHAEVQLTLESAETQEVRTISIKALSDETPARYREWVEQNRRIVHEASQGQVGYIHIPSMGNDGYAEFHRGYLSEYDYPGLLVDVRWNTGGYVSGLLLEKLARRRVGYDFSRWGQPEPYPVESPRGPMVALTNQYAGSDGDIFSHCFKLMQLGPLIGKRTWGGVIGISPRHRLVDGTMTTQPEFSFWFKDVGWSVENYGTDPDIDVDIAPQDYAQNVDPQLERAIAEVLHLIKEQPSLEPKPGDRPHIGRLNR